jgi:alpha-glucosidase
MTPRPWTALATLAALVAPGSAPAATPWWQGGAIYEIYPRSFADADGDGVGDLRGITAHLDYLAKLGIDAIWLTPTFPSPQVDFGYDISDYRAVDPQYGTMADLLRLQQEAGRRHIRLILDMVLNHTSDRHAWFQASAASRTGPKADWYVWNDGLPAATPGLSATQRANAHDGRVPPNNWTSVFGGSAWEWVPARRQFYYHKFYKQQPDLNWRNPAVEQAMFGVLRFWLDRGVAGFRLDAIPTLFEDPANADEPATGGLDPFGEPNLDHVKTENRDEVHGVIRRMRALVDGYPGDRVLIGETYLPDTAALDRWYGGAARDELHLPMDMLLGFGTGARYDAAYFRPQLADAQARLHGAMPLFVFDNHDQMRSIDRFGDGAHDEAIAKGIATILLASRATALTYYGAELGMRTTPPARIEDVRDPIGRTGWPKEKGRDGERTPMQWTPGAQAGFSANPATWLPVPPNHDRLNARTEAADPDSMLSWYGKLLALRRTVPALADGAMAMAGTDPDILAWTRTDARTGDRVLVAINMGRSVRRIAPAALDPALPAGGWRPLATAGEGTLAAGQLSLAPFAVWIGQAGPG